MAGRHHVFFASQETPKSKDDCRGVTAFPETVNTGEGDEVVARALTEHVITPACYTLEGEATEGSTTVAGATFAWTDFLWADFDDGKYTIETLKAAIPGVAFILYTSANHMKPKHGVMCPRFKVLFPLEKRVYDPGRLAKALQRLVKELGSDPAGSELKQKFFPPCRPDVEMVFEHGPRDIMAWLKDKKKLDAAADNKGAVGRGRRNAFLFEEACRLAIAGRDAAGVLAALQETRDLRCEDPDDKDISDQVLEDMARRAAARFEGSTYASRYQFYEKKFVKIREPLGLYDRSTGKVLSWDNSTKYYKTDPDNFCTLDDGKILDVWQTWLRFSRQNADCIEFAPDHGREAIREAERDGHQFTVMNTWHGLTPPNQSGSCDLFKEFLKGVIAGGDPAIAYWLWNYMAYIYQHPADNERRFCYAVALSGEQGTGKNTFFDIYSSLFMDARGESSSIESILNFNGELAGKIVFLFDEAFSSSWKNVRRTFKSLITSRSITINEKFVPKYTLANHCRFFFATNDEHSAPVEENDRRYVCLELSNTHRNDHAYFKALRDEAEHGGVGRLAWELSRVEVDEALLTERPKTQVWRDNMDYTRSEGDPLKSYFIDLLEEDDIVVQDVGTGFWELLDENQGWMSKRLLTEEVNRHAHAMRIPPLTVNKVTKHLRRLLGETREDIKTVDGKRGRSVFLGSRENIQSALDRGAK